MGFFTKALIGGAVAIGLGSTIKAKRKEKQRRLQEQAEEERRKSTPCSFSDGITEREFERIVNKTAKRFKRLKIFNIDKAVVMIEFYSQSGISKYYAVIDFNDYGHITGRYWIINDNDDSNLPTAFADCLSEQLVDAMNNPVSYYDNNRTDSNKNSNNYRHNSSYAYSTDTSHVKKNVFPVFCRKCGVRLVGKPYWCIVCGTQIREKRDWYCAFCGDLLNRQANFDTEPGVWACLKCNGLNLVEEHFY